jgi:phosphoglucomutase
MTKLPQVPITTVATTPFPDQRPGTSGLRKRTRVFMREHYLENFVQSVFDVMREQAGGDLGAATIVIGGDGRFYNRNATQIIIRMAVGNGFGTVLVGRDGLTSTPAMSAIIRRRGALGGLVLSASHNPGGIDGDFGIKYNVRNGGPAPEAVTERIYARTRTLAEYRIAHHEPVPLEREGERQIQATRVCVIDPISDYAAIMREIFDFDALRRLFAGGFRLCFDAMHAVTGPYAHYLFEDCLGAPSGTVLNGRPLEDFGGHHPDPNQVHAASLVARMESADAPDMGAASDGDGDRNMILGRSFFVTPGDSLAILAEHAQESIPGYRGGLAGVARSMPTSAAVDRVARALGIVCYETPVGWKFFGNLMDAGLITLCGEESFGTGSNHVREKDGLWAVLSWLSLLGATRLSVADVVRRHWRRFGRSFYQRHDYEDLQADAAGEMMRRFTERLATLPGEKVNGFAVEAADDFRYTDPVDGSVSEHQGLRVKMNDGSRIVYRVSGTSAESTTVRIYLERHCDGGFERPVGDVLAPLARTARELVDLKTFCGRDEPTLVT